MRMSDAPRLSPVEREILTLLINHGAMYGLEMVKSSPSKLKRGTIYVTLGRMEDKGWLKSKADEDSGEPGMARRRYTASGEGRKALEQREAFEAYMAVGKAQGAW
jgi:PadR family transcriptional regulator PadR